MSVERGMGQVAIEGNHPRFGDALAALDGGELETLTSLLVRYPALASARATSVEPPYDGYFHGATLLHHVAGNPVRGGLPANVVAIARALLEAGADPEAPCGGGPSQPGSGGGTTLGLVASGARAHMQGFTEALIDLLLEHGAALDAAGNGGLLWIALYHTVEHRGQREVARMLVDRGHPLDLCFAAGIGDGAAVASFLDDAGVPRADADRFYRHHRSGGNDAGPEQMLQDALLFAAVNGRVELVVRFLDQGVAPSVLRPWGPHMVTPLHGAAWAGWPEMVTLLLDRAADPTIVDPRYRTTPEGWAAHCGRAEAVAAFRAASANG